ncbi:MAG: GGDEF domain-containing protein [Burkholderiales bacterium]
MMDKTASPAPAPALAPKAGKPSAAVAKVTPAELAKGTLRRLATQRLEPTPANYARAWREEGGEDLPEPVAPAARAALQAFALRVLPPGAAREPLVEALASQRWDRLAAALPDEVVTPAQQAQDWADLIDRLVRQLDRSSKGWTPGRKKDSLQHVLTSARSDVQRLQQRLKQLVGSWDGEAGAGADDVGVSVAAPPPASAAMNSSATAPAPRLETPPPTDGPSLRRACALLEGAVQTALPSDTRAREVGSQLHALTARADSDAVDAGWVQALGVACEDVSRVLQHRHHLVDQLAGLINDLTAGLGDLSEDESWVRGQCEAMRGELSEGLSARGVRAVASLLHDTRLRQSQLRAERTEARDALKQLIHRMLQDLGELGTHTGRFNDNLGRYVEVIGQADTLSDLTEVVREMVDETRTVHSLVSQATERLADEHARAALLTGRVRELEDELRRLSDEVSTDQLTQVANRRGLIKRFDVEAAQAQREGTLLAVSILDLDNFKRLNDTLGHQTGDEALKFIARRVGEMLRPGDTLARYGGEEFVVLLPATPVEEAQRVLTRVQRLLSAELFMHENKQTFVTFSAGVTAYRLQEPIEAALQRADEALYEAKRSGKNRTCIG